MTTLLNDPSLPGKKPVNQNFDPACTLDQTVAQDYLQNLRQAYISLESVIGADAHRLTGPSNAHLREAQSLLHRLIRLTNDLVA
jgi:hypothetical protein